MSLFDLSVALERLSSAKITERKKGCESLFELIKKKSLIALLDSDEVEEDWDSFFRKVLDTLNREIARVEETASKGTKPAYTITDQITRLNDLLVTVVKMGNRKAAQINFELVLHAFKRCLKYPVHRSYLINRFLLMFRDHILPKHEYWGTIEPKQWTEMFEYFKALYKDSEENKALVCLHLIVKYGVKHKLSLSFVKSQYPFVKEVCQNVKKTSPVWLKETTLELFLDFCQQIVKNSRRLCCALGEEVLNNLLLLYEPYSTQAKIKFCLLEVLLFQVRIHHPLGAGEGQLDGDAYAASASTWSRCLRRLCYTINEIVETRDKNLLQSSETGRYLHPVFLQLAVEVYKQQNYRSVDENTQESSSKRICDEFRLSNIVHNIETSREWAWINLLSNILKKYPTLIDAVGFKKALTVLTNYLTECKVSETRSQIFDCLSALVQSESALASDLTNEDLDPLWSHAWDAALRSIGLNENQWQTHNLIQNLVASNNKQRQTQLASTYTSRAITITPISLKTLNILGSRDGLNSSSNDTKITLVKLILSSENNEVFASRVTGEVLVNLTLKQWPQSMETREVEAFNLEQLFRYCEVNGDLFCEEAIARKETSKQIPINIEVYTVLVDLLAEMSSNLTKETAPIALKVLPHFILLINVLNVFMDFEVEDGEVNLILILDRALELLWSVLGTFFEGIKSYSKKTEVVFGLILRLFEADVRHFVKDKVPVDLLQKFFELLAEDDEEEQKEEEGVRFDEDPKVRMKLRIVEVISCYCVHVRDDTQRHALNALLTFSIDARNPVDYSQAMIILRTLKTSTDYTSLDLKSACLMLKSICNIRYKEFDVANDILDIIYSLIPFTVEDDEVKQNLTALLMPFYQLRDNYGPEVAVKIAKCVGEMINMDPTLSHWWSEEDELLMVLPTLLLSKRTEVRFAAARNLIALFSQNGDKVDTQIYQCQKNVFNEMCKTFSLIFEDISEDEDETVNRTASVLYSLAAVITSSSLLRQKALYELFHVTHVHKLHLGKVDKILQKIGKRLNFEESHLLLENHLGYLLHRWNANHFSLKVFPVFLFCCQNDTVFYQQYISHILPILFNEEDSSVFENICEKIGKNAEEIIEDAYPKIVAKNLVTASQRASKEIEVSPEDISLTRNIQERIKRYLNEDNCQAIVLRRLDEVVVQLLQFVFDLEHFCEVFEVNYALPEPETTFLTVRLFEIALELLMEKVDSSGTSFMNFLTSKHDQTQRILLKLTRNIHKSTTSEDNILNFHRYSIYLNLLKPHISSEFPLSRFIVRDVTHNLMNLTRSAHPLLPLLSAKLFLNLTKTFTPHAFDNFLIVVASALVPVARTSASASSQSMNVLKTLIEDKNLREELRIMDPLPESVKFTELRRLHFEVKGNEDLHGVIQGFLRGGVRCRIEGLRYLRGELLRRRSELRKIYKQLYKSRGALNEDSVLHLLVCDLVRLTTSQNKKESIEAAKCLGELGSSNLTTMVLKTEDCLYNLDGKPTIVGASLIIKLLLEYLVDEDIEVTCSSSDALHAIFKTTDGQTVIKENMVSDVEYLAPFRFSGKVESSKLSVDKTAFISMLQDEEVWCPEGEVEHRKWITELVSGILDTVNEPGWYKVLIPLCRIKVSFAEKLLPVLINDLIDVNETAFKMFSGSVGRFFAKHWRFRKSGNGKSVFSQRPSVKAMLDVVHYVRLQRNVYAKTNRKHLELDLDYLQVASAAQFCGAHFSTLMYAELWCQRVAPDIRNSRQPTGSSVLELIRENRAENKALREILRQAYVNIGDGDALHNGELIDPLDPPTQVNAYMDLNRWDLVVLHYDIHGACGASAPHQHALKNFSLLDLSSKILPEPQYESLWRLGRWNLPTSKTPTSFEARNYYALKAFKENDGFLFEEIEAARLKIITSLRHESLESCKNLYEAATRLQCLQELEELEENHADFNAVLSRWKEKDSANRNEFQYVERVLSHRIALLRILIGRHDIANNHENRRPIGNKDSVVKALVDTHLDLSRLARLEGNLNVAKRAVDDLLKLELAEELRWEIVLESAQIFWEIDKKSGMQVLRSLLTRVRENPRFLSRALSLYGTWLVETKTESTKTIIAEYFLRSIKLLENSEFGEIFEATSRLARFADEEYQEILSYTEGPVFAAKIKNAAKLRENAEKLKENAENPDVRKAVVVFDRQSKIDGKEIENTLSEKNAYLKLALKYYLYNLKHSEAANITVFRVISLFLLNKQDAQLSALLLLPTHKLLAVLPQLLPHLTNNPDDLFGQKINDLFEKAAVDHPHHVLPLVLAVANSHRYDPNAPTAVEVRVDGAKALVERLRRRFDDRLVQNAELVAEALIQLAWHECPKDSKKLIPRDFLLRTVKGAHNVLVPTYNLPVRKNCDYKNIIGIHRFVESFEFVGGLNAPKLIKCVGTDGRTRNQLVKGKDDLRQDAVMQQVFTIMNGLLGSSKTTSDLLIRTYKISPLSKRCGILEWVDNSMPFGDYLVGPKGAHRVFNPGDISVDECRRQFRKLCDDPYDRKLAKYLKICEKFRPAFHRFFETTFLQPTEWYERRRFYTQSVATTSMCGYILGLGDRHVNNILVDKNSAEVIHIDFGIAFEQGKVLPTPETVPFRLTRDVEDGMGVAGVEGTFRRSCEKTMRVLRENANTILTILEVLLYDPLYAWTITPNQAYSRQLDLNERIDQPMSFSHDDAGGVNLTADRALKRLRQKLQGTEFDGFSSVEGQVGRLIQQARDPANLCKIYHGWQPYL